MNDSYPKEDILYFQFFCCFMCEREYLQFCWIPDQGDSDFQILFLSGLNHHFSLQKNLQTHHSSQNQADVFPRE